MSEKALKKILYIEDDPDIQVVGVLALEQVGGFSVTLASSGTEALALTPEVQPDLILLDVMMPGIDGLATFERLCADPATSEIPVVFMTAKVQSRELAQYQQIGAVRVIQKPFDPMKLADQIREIWQQLRKPGIDSGADE